MRTKIMFFIFAPIVFPAFAGNAFTNGSNDQNLCSKDIEQIVERKNRDYSIKIFYANDRTCQRIDIINQGQTVFHEEGSDYHYFLGTNGSGRYALGNLIGRGTQLVVKRWTGGAHCCTSLLIFDLGSDFRKLAEIDGGNFEPEIVDIDHDGIPEIRITDDFLAYRFSSFASSATGDVVLKYSNGHYTVAPEFMIRQPPSRKALDAKIPLWKNLLRKKGPDWPPPQMIQTLTDLIYTGNRDLAFELLNRAWPADVIGRSEFLESYQAALNDSKYYLEFYGKMNF